MIKQKKILVADDDVQFVDSIKTLLENSGYEVTTTYRSEEVLPILKGSRPDLILLDVMFAGDKNTDGFDVSRALNKEPLLSDIPVIILSGVRKVLNLPYGLEPDERWMPVKAFLEKPVKPDELLTEVKKILGPVSSTLS